MMILTAVDGWTQNDPAVKVGIYYTTAAQSSLANIKTQQRNARTVLTLFNSSLSSSVNYEFQFFETRLALKFE